MYSTHTYIIYTIPNLSLPGRLDPGRPGVVSSVQRRLAGATHVLCACSQSATTTQSLISVTVTSSASLGGDKAGDSLGGAWWRQELPQLLVQLRDGEARAASRYRCLLDVRKLERHGGGAAEQQ